MIVPELPAEIRDLKEAVGRFVEAEVYPFEDRIAAAAAYLGIPGGFDGFRSRIVALCSELKITKGLAAMGVDEIACGRPDWIRQIADADRG